MNPLSSSVPNHFGSTYVLTDVPSSKLLTLANRAKTTFPEGEVIVDASKGPDALSLKISVPDKFDQLVKLGLQQAGVGDKFVKETPKGHH